MAAVSEQSANRGLAERDPNAAASIRRKPRRKRAALACEECRLRKRRCDGATPVCGGCTKRMSACVYSAEVQAKVARNSMIEALKRRLKELEQKETSPSPPPPAGRESGIECQDQTLSAAYSPRQEEVIGSDRATADGTELLAPHRMAESPLTDITPSADHIEAAAVSGEPIAVGQETHVPKKFPLGQLEPCSIDRQMQPIYQALGTESCHNLPALLGPEVSLDAGTSRIDAGCSCDQLLAGIRWKLPLRRHADSLIDLYFSRVHRIYPILHHYVFRRQYERLWQSATSITAPSRVNACCRLCKQITLAKTFPATVYTVFALASLLDVGTPEQNTQQAAAFFLQMQEFNFLEVLEDEVGIELIQLGLLMGFYLQSTEQFSKCWNVTGLTIRMAQNMGLHLSLSEARKRGLFTPCATQLECEMRIRVWYGCVLLDREISMSFGRPLMIATGNEEMKLPASIDDSYLSDEMETWNAQLETTPSLLESYIQTIKLYDILGQVLDREERRYSRSIESHSASSIEANIDIQSLMSLDTIIMEWKDSLPAYLQYDPYVQDCSEGERVSTDGTARRQAAFLAQAKRLYTRFLHVRVLILRPALDLLFQKQRHNPSMTKRRTPDARVQDLVLSSLAVQCVSSAHNLVKFLDAQIRSRTLVAWWYNISYLHTCGSTLLMGQMCTLADFPSLEQSLTLSWELCMQCISRYTKLSSIADKSFRILRESAKKLLPHDLPQKDKSAINTIHQPPASHEVPLQESTCETRNPSHPLPPQSSVNYTSGIDLADTRLDALDNDTWLNDADYNSYWSLHRFCLS